jgi:hypothetical protein
MPSGFIRSLPKNHYSLIVLFAFTTRLFANDPWSRDDDWDWSRPESERIIIEAYTPLFNGIDILDLFGATNSATEAGSGNIFFSDTPPEDNIYYVEFSTPEDIPLEGFRCILSSDRPTGARGASHLNFFADVDRNGGWVKLASIDIDQSLFGNIDVIAGLVPNPERITNMFPERIIANRFRIEFIPSTETQSGYAKGVRVVELDSFTTPNTGPPRLTFLNPINGASFNSGDNLFLEVDASDEEGIDRVEFWYENQFEGTAFLGEAAKGSSYTFTWTNAPAGYSTLTARAVDILGKAAVARIDIVVEAAPPPPLLLKNPVFSFSSREFRFDLEGATDGVTQVIFRSPNLRDWTAIATNQASGSASYTIIDPEANGQAFFYRTLQMEW